MTNEDDVRAQVRLHGFSYLGVVPDAILGQAQARLNAAPELKPGCDLHFTGFTTLLTGTGFRSLVELVVGQLSPLDDKAQVTRRQPNEPPVSAHLDGFNSREELEPQTPDAIIGVYLSDVPTAAYGPFTAWPLNRHDVKHWAAQHNGKPPQNTPMPQVATEAGLNVLGPAGTAFLVHGAVLHCQATRTVSGGTRDAVFFRCYRESQNVSRLLLSGGEDWAY